MITIFIPTPLRKFTGDEAQVKVEAENVGQAIKKLAEKYPELQNHLLDDDRNLRKFIRVYVGDEDIHAMQGEQTALASGDQVSIIPAIAGG